MPMSRRARNDWLGSSTSPPLIRRSNLSSGPMAARAGCQRPAAAIPSAVELEPTRKLRRETTNMTYPPTMARLRLPGFERQHVGGEVLNQARFSQPRFVTRWISAAPFQCAGRSRQPFDGGRRPAALQHRAPTRLEPHREIERAGGGGGAGRLPPAGGGAGRGVGWAGGGPVGPGGRGGA